MTWTCNSQNNFVYSAGIYVTSIYRIPNLANRYQCCPGSKWQFYTHDVFVFVLSLTLTLRLVSPNVLCNLEYVIAPDTWLYGVFLKIRSKRVFHWPQPWHFTYVFDFTGQCRDHTRLSPLVCEHTHASTAYTNKRMRTRACYYNLISMRGEINYI
jgi:hypothetical protein